MQDKGLRIAWQYNKYFGGNQHGVDGHKDGKLEFCNDFDFRKPLEKAFIFGGQRVDCLSFKDCPTLTALKDCCGTFLSQFQRYYGNISSIARIALQSLCAPQFEHSITEWATLSFIGSPKTMLQSANAVAIVIFPPSLLSLSCCKRLQHMADILLSVRVIPDDDKGLAKVLTGYQDMVDFLNIHKIARINSQVPVILEATTFPIKLQKRRFPVLKSLNQAPIDDSSGHIW